VLAATVEEDLKGGGEPDGEAIAALRVGLSATLVELASRWTDRSGGVPENTPAAPEN